MSQDTKEFLLDSKTRSIIEAEESATLAGLVTIYENLFLGELILIWVVLWVDVKVITESKIMKALRPQR